MSRVAVLGSGSWGTTLAIHLAHAGHEARLWGVPLADLEAIQAHRENRKFLPGIAVPEGVKVRAELKAAVEGAEFLVVVVPSQAVRSVAEQVRATGSDAVLVSASKGLELHSLKRMSEVLEETLGAVDPVVLTGPSHAEEVSRGIPTSVVAAARDEARARAVQVLFSTPRFRVYTHTDVPGCEYAAALKNVIAIAAGVCDGLEYGDNTKGALMARGMAEMARLGVAMGAERETFFGLAGIGDLITTAMSRHSRNRLVGERLGRGETLERILGDMVMVAEGVSTARAAHDLGLRAKVEMPLTDQVCDILDGVTRPRDALHALMSRGLKSERVESS